MSDFLYKVSQYAAKNLSIVAVILFLIISITYRDSNRRYRQDPGIISYDMAGYYAYMQAFWINGDYSFSFLTSRPHQSGLVHMLDAEGKNVFVNKYSVGPAILLSPFFMLGHLESYYQEVPHDGFSYTYRFWMCTGALIYAMLALLLLRKLLLPYFDDKVAASVLVVFIFGTNLWHYTVDQPIMSHVYSFFLFGLAIWWSQCWLKSSKWRYLIGLALTCGLIGVTRLPNMVFFLVPVFWGVYTIESLKERFLFLIKNWKQIIVGLFVFLIPFVPQVAYWYCQTGFFWVEAYSENNENMYWLQPMIAEVLIGYRKGWLTYTPAMLLGLVGFYPLYKQYKSIMPVLLIYLCINIYVVACWGCYWYGGSFGMRALIESSIVLSYPMAALFHKAYQVVWSTILLSLVSLSLITLNQIQTLQINQGVLHWGEMSREAYWTIFCKIPPLSEEEMKQRDAHLLKANPWEESNRKMYQQSIW